MILHILLDRIKPNPWQTRLGDPSPDYIRELAMDIASNGLLQNPIGRIVFLEKPIEILGPIDQNYLDGKLADPSYTVELAFGHNRLAAYRYLSIGATENTLNNFTRLPIEIRTLTDQQMALLAWSENEKRRDVTPIERARAIEKRMADFGWSVADVAEQLGLARPTVSNILRLLKLPQEIQAALSNGDISVRVASALLPIYDLPEHIITQANQDYWNSPKSIVKNALNGESSDRIRSQVETLYRNNTRLLQDAEFKLDDVFPENLTVSGYDFEGMNCTVYCGTCRNCDRRIKHDGNICLDPDCFRAKTTLYRRNYLSSAAYAINIEVSDPMKGGNVSMFSQWQADVVKKIVAGKCNNLCLVYSADPIKSTDARHVPGFPHALIACDKRNNSCTCLKGLELASRQPVSKIELEEKAFSEDPDYEGPENNDDDDDDDDDELNLSEDDIEAGMEYGRRNHPEPVRAQTPTPQQLEDLARQARQAKKDALTHKSALRDQLQTAAIEWLKDQQPGALAVLTQRTYMVTVKDIDKVWKAAGRGIADTIIGTSDYNSVEEMYEVINRRLLAAGLPAINQAKSLADVFAEQEEAL